LDYSRSTTVDQLNYVAFVRRDSLSFEKWVRGARRLYSVRYCDAKSRREGAFAAMGLFDARLKYHRALYHPACRDDSYARLHLIELAFLEHLITQPARACVLSRLRFSRITVGTCFS